MRNAICSTLIHTVCQNSEIVTLVSADVCGVYVHVSPKVANGTKMIVDSEAV